MTPQRLYVNGILADFDDVAACGCSGIGAFDELLRYFVEFGGLRTLGPSQRDGESAISAFTNSRDEFDGTEERDFELRRRALGAASGEDVDLLMAVRASEVAHVLDDAEDFDIDLCKHLEGFACVLQADIAGRGDDNGSCKRNSLDQGD